MGAPDEKQRCASEKNHGTINTLAAARLQAFIPLTAFQSCGVLNKNAVLFQSCENILWPFVSISSLRLNIYIFFLPVDSTRWFKDTPRDGSRGQTQS